ncbi:hypothetical protein EZV62_008523 [Acer yangbiense]|uniref:Uncharacterized protein n=1 Tax=Acer yangbiense TaxID=1000413 RepID=A0A5C7IDX0_9ROSI|nr:hypothetical protein EZV62_008523 [Acer yangbiense]
MTLLAEYGFGSRLSGRRHKCFDKSVNRIIEIREYLLFKADNDALQAENQKLHAESVMKLCWMAKASASSSVQAAAVIALSIHVPQNQDFALTHVDEVIDEQITKGYFVCHCNAGHSCGIVVC